MTDSPSQPDFPADLSVPAEEASADLRHRLDDLSSGRQSTAEPALGYATTWTVDDSLENLNLRIHDGVALEQLLDRARGYRDQLFNLFPEAGPAPSDTVLELGSGVGWIMQAMLERFPVKEIVGLDISANMIARAQERFADDRARFVLYDGFTIPFDDSSIPMMYSVAAMQHIEKHVAFLLFEELYRILAPGGHGIIHLLSVDHIPSADPNFHDECWNHVRNLPTHWHHYYSFDELFVLFADVIGVSDLDIVHEDVTNSFFVHFSKGTGRPFRRAELPSLRSGNVPAPAVVAPATTWGSIGRDALKLLPAPVQSVARRAYRLRG